ncbi:MAG: hypothetical protein ABI284_03470 [Nitrosospira sp.]
MNKLISTVILGVFAAVCSFGSVAADTSNKNSGTAVNPTDDSLKKIDKEKWEKEYGKGGKGDKSTSQIMENKEPADMSADEKFKYRDQETMKTKPYEK